jgi:hypothetical protein
MVRITISVALLISYSAGAQLRVPERSLPAIADPTMVLVDHGAKIEIFPSQRAMLEPADQGQRAVQRVTTTSTTVPMDSAHLGVVFNHAMQQQGYITGEIAFKMKPDSSPGAWDPTQYPGLNKILPSGVYVVMAATPAQFVAIFKRLQAEPDVEWVEPTVTYGPVATPTDN